MSHIYCKYCEAKIAFLEALIDNLLELHDLGGTIPIFHSFDDWYSNKINKDDRKKTMEKNYEM